MVSWIKYYLKIFSVTRGGRAAAGTFEAVVVVKPWVLQAVAQLWTSSTTKRYQLKLILEIEKRNREGKMVELTVQGRRNGGIEREEDAPFILILFNKKCPRSVVYRIYGWYFVIKIRGFFY